MVDLNETNKHFFLDSNTPEENAFLRDILGDPEIHHLRERRDYSRNGGVQPIQKSKFVHQRTTKNGSLTLEENRFLQSLWNSYH